MGIEVETAELDRLTRRLEARARELDCLYGISRIVEEGGTVERILERSVRILPDACGDAGATGARIVLRGREFVTDGFRSSPRARAAELRVAGEVAGSVEIHFPDPHTAGGETRSPAGEGALLDDVAQRLGDAIERIETERSVREREAELRRRLAHLTRITTLGELASAIAHEVNQPLTAIAVYAQACRRMLKECGDEGAQAAEILGKVTDEALRAGEIIHRLKALVRQGDGARELRDVNALIRGIGHLAAMDAQLHDVEVSFELAEGLPSVWVDEVQIQQVVLNLVRNAVDALEEPRAEDRRVRVRTSCVGGEVRVGVSDRGCGLPPDATDAIFKPFYTTKKGGVGLGLSVSRSILTAHEGRMWFEREAAGGTTFHFALPAAGAERG